MADLRQRELERALVDLGAHLEHPPTPPIAEAVVARITAPDAGRARAPRSRAWLPRPGWRRVATAALALVVLAVVVVAATPGAREAVARRLGLPGVAIHLGGPAPTTPAPPAPTLSTVPAAPGANLDLGRRVTLTQARTGVSFKLLVPSAPGLQRPDAVYLSEGVPGGRVDMLWRPRAGLPASPFTNAGLLLTEFRADPLVDKIAKGASNVTAVEVGGATGYWFAGAPHSFVYTDSGGKVREETARLAGNTLLWTNGNLILRLEGQISQRDAIRIAESVH
jgi:hypothetical protein